MPRNFNAVLPVFLVSIAAVLLLATFVPPVATPVQQLAQLMPAPFQGQPLATAGLLGVMLGTALSFLLHPGQAATISHRARARVSPAARTSSPRQTLLSSPKIQGWRPLPPAFKYFGGKSRLAPKIVARIPEHNTWVEPFAGGASVTLAKPPSSREVLADKRADILRFYRHIRSGKAIKPSAMTKENFKRIKNKPEAARTPGELYTLQTRSFGGHGQSYTENSPSSGSLLNKRLPLYADRLKQTTILSGDYRSILRKYDSKKTANYLDPPYPTDKVGYTDYGRQIPPVSEVKSAVEHLKGKVMISYPDLPSVREAFKPPHWRTERFIVHRPLAHYTGTSPTRTELLITNYNPRRDHWQPETVTG